MKLCRGCRQTLPATLFWKSKSHKDGLGTYCKPCDNGRHRHWYRYRDRKAARASGKATLYTRFHHAKCMARKRKLLWAISFEDYCWLQSLNCFYCDEWFCKERKSGTGLDRIDNSKGYVLQNVVTACGACNTIRSNYLTLEEAQVAIQAALLFRYTKCQEEKVAYP
jgi:hypothetical protein